MTLRIGISSIPTTREALDYVVEAERLGADSVWVPEFWGYDCMTPLGAVAAMTETIKLRTSIAQLDARTPAMLAMASLSLQALSDGRFALGIGTSGPQVMEGFHGVDFARPIRRTRETIDIIRAVTSGEPVQYEGEIYQLPRPGGAGKVLRVAAPPADIPIYVAALGPANLALTGELAQGWIGNSFFPETADVFFDEIQRGADRASRQLSDIDLTVSVGVEFTDDPDAAAKRHARGYAFTFGAMGSGSKNFYSEAFARQGWGDDVAEVGRLWRSGDREAARERVPAAIGARTNLLGTDDMIKDRLRLYRTAGVGTLRINPIGETLDEQLAGLGHLLELTAAVNAEPETM